MEEAGIAIEFWHWLVIGFALASLETVVRGAVFFWMGVSAVAVGVIVWVAPALSVEVQVFLFALLSVVAVVSWRRYRAANANSGRGDDTESPPSAGAG